MVQAIASKNRKPLDLRLRTFYQLSRTAALLLLVLITLFQIVVVDAFVFRRVERHFTEAIAKRNAE